MGCQQAAALAAGTQPSQYKGHVRGDLVCNIIGMGGPICTVSLPAQAFFRDLQQSIEEQTGIARCSQRLIFATEEVRNDSDLARLSSGAEVVDLTLVRRSAEQTSWLEDLEEAPAALSWLAAAADGPRADLEVMLRVVAQSGEALRFAAPELRAERGLALAAVAQDGKAIKYAAPELRADSGVALAAVTQSGLALEFVASELQADRELALAAVTQDGQALRFAAPALRTDRQVARTAVAQHQRALRSKAAEHQWAGPWIDRA